MLNWYLPALTNKGLFVGFRLGLLIYPVPIEMPGMTLNGKLFAIQLSQVQNIICVVPIIMLVKIYVLSTHPQYGVVIYQPITGSSGFTTSQVVLRVQSLGWIFQILTFGAGSSGLQPPGGSSVY